MIEFLFHGNYKKAYVTTADELCNYIRRNHKALYAETNRHYFDKGHTIMHLKKRELTAVEVGYIADKVRPWILDSWYVYLILTDMVNKEIVPEGYLIVEG